MEYSIKESSWSRAKRDTIKAQTTVIFMWGGEGVLAVAGGAWFQGLAPTGASTWELVLRAVVGGLIGLASAVTLIYCWNLFRAPYRQRDEVRRLALSTEQELNTQISSLQKSLLQLQEAMPKIQVELAVSEQHFYIIVRNPGSIGADFTANGRLIKCSPYKEQYLMYWEGYGGKCHINGRGGFAKLLVAEKSPTSFCILIILNLVFSKAK